MAIYNGGLNVKNVTIGKETGTGNAITSLSADGNVITATKGTTFLTSLPNHNHNYAGSSSAGGPATEFTAELADGNTDRYIYFAWNDTDYNNSNASSITKGKAVIDTEFKYNPYTNKLSTGSVQLNSKVTLQYNSSTESLDFVFA